MTGARLVKAAADRAAANSEILRLIWASLKEAYLTDEDRVLFTVERPGVETLSIRRKSDADAVLYDCSPRDEMSIAVISEGRRRTLTAPSKLLDFLLPFLRRAYPQWPFEEERWSRFLQVCDYSVYCEALALRNKWRFDSTLSAHSLFEKGLSLNARESFAFFCRYSSYVGRRDMPLAKMRLPVSNRLAVACGPEFGREIRVYLTAIKTELLTINAAPGFCPKQAIATDFPAGLEAWVEALLELGLDPCEYAPFPVHPLSMPLFAHRLDTYVRRNLVVLLEHVRFSCWGSLSYRTMIPARKPGKHHWKLPVPIQLTGWIRYIDNEELEKAPQVSEVIADILDGDASIGEHLALDRELATVWLSPSEEAGVGREDTRYLSYLVRERQGAMIPKGYVTMPLAAIFTATRQSSVPVIVEAMMRGGVSDGTGALRYFGRYVELTCGSVFRLFLRHGIALEAHQQNMGITFAGDGAVWKLHYHDVAYAVYTYAPVYLAAGNDASVLLGLPYVYQTPCAPTAQLVHTLLECNLFPFVEVVAAHYDLEKPILYELIAGRIRDELDRGRAGWQAGEQDDLVRGFYAHIERQLLDSPHYPVKRLLGKIYQQSQTAHWGEVPNECEEYASVKATRVMQGNPLCGLQSRAR